LVGLLGRSAEDVFRKFKDHLSGILNKTVVQAPLSLILAPPKAFLEFRQNDRSVCVKVGGRYHLYVGQTLEAIRQDDRYRLRTIAYAYRISEGPTFDDRCLFRWEYNARDYKPSLSPRHHLHIPAKIQCMGNRELDAERLHIPTGWITVEEVIRFLIHELKVKPKSNDWDEILKESEKKFRDWTGREA
jgi:hypothetical protein